MYAHFLLYVLALLVRSLNITLTIMQKLIIFLISITFLPTIALTQSETGKKGFQFFQEKKYHEAIETFTTLIEKNDGEKFVGYYFKGYSYYKLGLPDKAIEDIKKAMEINKEHEWYSWINGSSNFLLGRIFDKQGDRNKAIEYMYKSIGFVNDDSNAFSTLALMEYENEAYGNAYKNILKAIELNEKDPYAYSNQSVILLKLNKVEEALTSANISISLNDENPYAFKHRALIYFEMNEKEKACSDLNTAKKLNYVGFGGNMNESDFTDVDQLIEENCQSAIKD